MSYNRAGTEGLWPRSDGTVSIEFAVLLPVFLALLFGLIVFGVQYSARIALTYAAAEGGRAALAGLDDAERQSLAVTRVQTVLQSLAPLVDPAKANVQVVFSTDSGGEQIVVSIAYDDSRFAQLPFVPSMAGLTPVAASYLVTDPLG